ncbi:zinc finger protein 334 isoform X2 [Daphnia magna]|uniref:zinc finger protein 334 isoform X2 n=1 Tax=Daphnia magna TaxID=35525 RepID=UPI0006DD7822|nr:zinc finger protein 334 isoform X2 [Daphnia magna]
MTSTAMKGPIEIIYISDDEPNDCLINSAGSCLKSGSQAMSSDGKRLLHNLQEVVSRSDLTNLESSNTKVSLDMKKNHGEISSLSKHQSPIKTYCVNISSTDGTRKWFNVVPYKAKDIRGDHQCSSASLSENLEKENGKTPRSTKSRRKVVSAEECDTCSPPFHTCKQFANITGNFTPNRRNIKLNKFVELKPIDIYKCEVCSKAFSREWIRVRHQLIHTDPGTWNNCTLCRYKTPHITSMRLHLKHHKARGTLRKIKVPQTEIIDQAKIRKIKEKRRPFWQCIYCQKKFQLADYCEQHELCCREGNRGRRSKVLARQLREAPSHPEKYQ